MLPKLPRPEFWIHETLNQAGVGALLRQIARALRLPTESLLQKVLHRGRQTQSLDPLGSPLRRDFMTGRPPNLFGITLEEGEVELPSEPINQKVLKALLRCNLAHSRLQIARSHPERSYQPEILQRRRRQRNGIVEELAQIIDSAFARTYKHHQVRVVRCHLYEDVGFFCLRLFGLGFLSSVRVDGAGSAKNGFLMQVRGHGNNAL